MAEQKSLIRRVWDAVVAFPSRNMESPPEPIAQFKAAWREMLKDVNNTLHQVFFGQHVSPGEPGTPLVPTQAQVTKEQGNVYGYHNLLEDAASRGPVHGQQQQKGIER